MDDPLAEVEIKPQLKSRGRVAKEEDLKPSHQLLSFSLSHFFYCHYKPLPLHWAFAVLGSFHFFLSLLFLILIFKPIIIFSTFIPLFAFATVLFPLQLIFNIYKSSLSTSI